ncbi:MAG: Uma2 family endonuclease [Isosphaerales bacterium]
MSLAMLAPPAFETIADLLESLGDIPPERVRMHPWPGTATEEDVLAIHAREKRLCELVDGVLVEKPMGFDESRLAIEIGYSLVDFLHRHDLGTAAGEAGMMRLMAGLVRIPDVSFIRWEHLPQSYGPIPPIAPDLAVEVLSESNTPKEMERKLHEYFGAGTQLVWYFDPKARTVTVYTAPDQFAVLDESQTLDGGEVLPGLVLPLHELFERASRRGRPGA